MEQNKKNGTAISKDINENMKKFKQIFADCSDIKMRQMYSGRGTESRLYDLICGDIGGQHHVGIVCAGTAFPSASETAV